MQIGYDNGHIFIYFDALFAFRLHADGRYMLSSKIFVAAN